MSTTGSIGEDRPPRSTLACAFCRARKIRCSGGNPCKRCGDLKRTCEYAKVTSEENQAARARKAAQAARRNALALASEAQVNASPGSAPLPPIDLPPLPLLRRPDDGQPPSRPRLLKHASDSSVPIARKRLRNLGVAAPDGLRHPHGNQSGSSSDDLPTGYSGRHVPAPLQLAYSTHSAPRGHAPRFDDYPEPWSADSSACTSPFPFSPANASPVLMPDDYSPDADFAYALRHARFRGDPVRDESPWLSSPSLPANPDDPFSQLFNRDGASGEPGQTFLTDDVVDSIDPAILSLLDQQTPALGSSDGDHFGNPSPQSHATSTSTSSADSTPMIPTPGPLHTGFPPTSGPYPTMMEPDMMTEMDALGDDDFVFSGKLLVDPAYQNDHEIPFDNDKKSMRFSHPGPPGQHAHSYGHAPAGLAAPFVERPSTQMQHRTVSAQPSHRSQNIRHGHSVSLSYPSVSRAPTSPSDDRRRVLVRPGQGVLRHARSWTVANRNYHDLPPMPVSRARHHLLGSHPLASEAYGLSHHDARQAGSPPSGWIDANSTSPSSYNDAYLAGYASALSGAPSPSPLAYSNVSFRGRPSLSGRSCTSPAVTTVFDSPSPAHGDHESRWAGPDASPAQAGLLGASPGANESWSMDGILSEPSPASVPFDSPSPYRMPSRNNSMAGTISRASHRSGSAAGHHHHGCGCACGRGTPLHAGQHPSPHHHMPPPPLPMKSSSSFKREDEELSLSLKSEGPRLGSSYYTSSVFPNSSRPGQQGH